MRHWLQHIRQHAFWRSVITLLSGSALAQGLNLLLLPLLADLYDTTAFGVQAVFMALVQTVAIAANGGYDQAIMLPEASAEAHALFRLSQGLALGVALLVSLGLVAADPWLWRLMEVEDLGGWQWLLPLSLWLESSMQPLRIMLNRLGAYRTLALSKLLRALVAGGLMLGLGWAEVGFAGLLIGWSAGLLTAWLALMVAYLLALHRHPVPRQALRQVAWAYRDFPLKSVGSSFLNNFSRQLPFYLLPAFFGQTVNGYYFMAYRALMLPMSLVSGAIGEVFYRQAALRKAQGAAAVAALLRRTALQLAGLGALPLVLLMAIGPWLAVVALGPEWEPAGVYVRWLMPWVFLTFVASPLTSLTDIYRRLEAELTYNVLLLLARGGTLLLGGYWLGAQQTVIGYAVVGSLMMGGYLWFLFHLIQQEQRREGQLLASPPFQP